MSLVTPPNSNGWNIPISGLTRFPTNESFRRTGLHLSLSEKSSCFTSLHLRSLFHFVQPPVSLCRTCRAPYSNDLRCTKTTSARRFFRCGRGPQRDGVWRWACCARQACSAFWPHAFSGLPHNFFYHQLSVKKRDFWGVLNYLIHRFSATSGAP